jgi:hypothetical protein
MEECLKHDFDGYEIILEDSFILRFAPALALASRLDGEMLAQQRGIAIVENGAA